MESSSYFSGLPIPLAVLLLTVVYIYFHAYHSRKAKLLSRFPGPKKLPVLGNSLELMTPTEVLKNMTRWERDHGPRFCMSFGAGQELISLSEPSDLERVMTSSDLIQKSSLYDTMKPWLGDGLLISTGKKWHNRRKMLTPAFHFKILDQFQRIFNEKTKDVVNLINEKLQDDQDVLEMHSVFTKSTLDIICETAMGKKLNCLRDPENPFLKATLRESQFMWKRWTSPWLKPDFMWELSPTGRDERANRRILDDFTNKVIQERKTEFVKTFSDENILNPTAEKSADENVYLSSKKKVAFLDLLLHYQASGGDCALTDEDIREETATFMFEGHDTTASALTWALYLLGLHPEHQKIVCDELDEVFGGDTERPVDAADLAKLKYLEMCIKESLRLLPTVPLISRQVTQDFELGNGLVIPEGAMIVPNIYQVHHRPDLYPDPFEYRPERFSAENILNRHPYAFIPFSAGPRNCIGQKFAYAEVKTTLANIFRNFSANTVAPLMKELQPIPELVLRPKDGVQVQFKRRYWNC